LIIDIPTVLDEHPSWNAERIKPIHIDAAAKKCLPER
jgi:hypothetical protein